MTVGELVQVSTMFVGGELHARNKSNKGGSMSSQIEVIQNEQGWFPLSKTISNNLCRLYFANVDFSATLIPGHQIYGYCY